MGVVYQTNTIVKQCVDLFICSKTAGDIFVLEFNLIKVRSNLIASSVLEILNSKMYQLDIMFLKVNLLKYQGANL